jgi:hypothetical protein
MLTKNYFFIIHSFIQKRYEKLKAHKPNIYFFKII